MNSKKLRVILPAGALAAVACAALLAQPTPTPKGPSTGASSFPTVESLVTELYRSVSFEVDQSPDWQKVRAMFIPEAVVVLRTARDKMSVFSVQGFVDDFINFIDRSEARRKGFSERIVHLKPLVYGDMAHVLVLYEAQLGGSERPPQRGVDSFELVRMSDRWWIVSITNEICTPERPLPPELRD